jgi:hypothetical protein
LAITDSTFSSSEGLVTCEEREALGLFTEQHGGKIAVADTNLTIVSNGSGDTERLDALADRLSRFR